MRCLPRASIVAVAVLVMAGVAGCDPGVSDPTPSPIVDASSPASSATPTLTPTPTPTPTEVDEEAGARQAVLDYYEVYNQIAMGEKGEPEDLKQVAGGEQLEVFRAELTGYRTRGWKSTAPLRVTNLSVGAIEARGDTLSVTATFCVDATGVDLVDRDGDSHLAEGRPDRFNSVMVLEKQADKWLAIRERDGGNACET